MSSNWWDCSNNNNNNNNGRGSLNNPRRRRSARNNCNIICPLRLGNSQLLRCRRCRRRGTYWVSQGKEVQVSTSSAHRYLSRVRSLPSQ
jgi:hypothetical protein